MCSATIGDNPAEEAETMRMDIRRFIVCLVVLTLAALGRETAQAQSIQVRVLDGGVESVS